MPLYSMFCMAKPAVGRAAVGSMMRLAGNTVLEKGGVLTDIVSFGQQDLAYDIRNQGVKYSQVGASRNHRPPSSLEVWPLRRWPRRSCSSQVVFGAGRDLSDGFHGGPRRAGGP